jgi:transcriptional regulator GlxA family with amidase domain
MQMPTSEMSDVERRVVLEIRALRAEQIKTGVAGLLDDPVALVRHLVVQAHGSTKLRFETIADELGIELRTLERAFKLRFGVSMKQSAGNTRLRFAKHLLITDPSHKVSSIANLLGYRSYQTFIRFFRRRTETTPALWVAQQQQMQDSVDDDRHDASDEKS